MNLSTKLPYVAPQIECLEITIEAGYAQSDPESAADAGSGINDYDEIPW